VSNLPRGFAEVVQQLRELEPALQRSDAVRRLADLARVPKNEQRQELFRVLIRNLLFDAWLNEGRLRLTSKDVALSRAASALQSARQALTGLDEHEREALRGPISMMENGIDQFLFNVLGRLVVPRPAEHRSGRRTGTVNNPRFQAFAQALFLAAEATGGQFTLEKNIGKGGVIDAIDILRPHLPDGFLPKQLPLSTLQRIKTRVSKFWRTSNQ
jgi:hypothetical protein